MPNALDQHARHTGDDPALSGPFREMLTDYILSGHAYLHVRTTEKTRFLIELEGIASNLPGDGRPVFVQSQATGLGRFDGNPAADAQFGKPPIQKVAQEILDLPAEAVFVLKGFGHYLWSKTFSDFDVVTAWLAEIRNLLVIGSCVSRANG